MKKAKNTKANVASTLKTLLAAYVMEVEFTKQNGENRVMVCTTKNDKIPEEMQPKGESKVPVNEEVIRVFDIESQGWRSFRVDSIKKFAFTK